VEQQRAPLGIALLFVVVHGGSEAQPSWRPLSAAENLSYELTTEAPGE
jgi:hypothetical protein